MKTTCFFPPCHILKLSFPCIFIHSSEPMKLHPIDGGCSRLLLEKLTNRLAISDSSHF